MAGRPNTFAIDDVNDPDAVSGWSQGSRGKRYFDIIAASIMLVIFLPLMITISVLIMMCDGGPVFYKHVRVGKGGKEFLCYKFRTMVVDADEKLQQLLVDPKFQKEWFAVRKLRDDPRIIPRIGNMLRRSSLDELPQILNVLKGDMAIVGPRPIVEDELQYYGAERYLYLKVRPGLTGPWQATDRSDSSYDERVRLDADYILHGTLFDDVRLVLVTARKFVMLSCRGAY